MTFRHFGRAEELSDRRVMCIEEDSLGFLWVGTKLGLNRLEGHCFRSFYKGTSGLTSNNINDLLQGEDSRLRMERRHYTFCGKRKSCWLSPT